MLRELTDPEAVRKAIREFDRVGRAAFLEHNHFHEALRYFVVADGKEYDSKAIVGVAYGIQHPSHGPLKPDQFNGGKPVLAVLRRLGFEVVDHGPVR